ncbi:MAG TPA: 30S ribosomal protein S20 [Alphaproteobacteria bacterium]|nr:30S ribosomal protein S20 [Alphaproteobacteria bacterium]
MANTAQQRKRVRQDEKRNASLAARRSRIRTFLKSFEEALTSGKKESIASSFKAAMSELAKGAQKGAISKGAASRKVSRLAARIGKKA